MLSTETAVRLGVFLAVFGVMAGWELLAARRELTVRKGRRWFGNLSLVVLDVAIVRLLFPAAAVGMALTADELGWGLFHWFPVPNWLAIALSIVVLDLAVYLQHLMFHAVPALWRLHMVHHADVDLDVTTGLRFHPIEIVFSMLIKLAVVAVLGAPFLGVLIFELLLNALAIFNHANVRLTRGLEAALRRILVTPDMHRVHHSTDANEHSTNFGFNLSWWDRLFGTYLAQPADGHAGMKIGLQDFREARWRELPRMLVMPFHKPAAGEATRKATEDPNQA